MEEDQCWIRSKRKYHMSSSLDSSTNYPSPYDDHSWEEQAFAKDAAWSGCIWPPRSYSCSFCKREFRSAQALGGHMNVHRRDRARLKHQHSPQNEILSDDDVEKTQPRIPVQISFTSWGCLYPSSLSGLAHSTNPNSDACSHVPASPSKVLATSNNKISREKPQTPLCIGFHESYPDLPSKSRSNLTEDFRFCSHRHDPESGVEKSLKGLDSGCTSEGDRHKSKTDVAESLSLFTSQAYTPVQFETKETDSSFKKRKADASSIPFFPNSCSVDSHHMQSQMFEFSPRSVEELDLELSLGYKSRE